MAIGKGAYLEEITSGLRIPSRTIEREFEGSSPPSVFVGRWNYPRVLAGPLIATLHGDTRIMDTPESWIPAKTTQEEIIGYRLGLVRGMRAIAVDDMESRFSEQLREIALASSSIESEASFDRAPQGRTFSDDHLPFGPSATLERLDLENPRWDPDLERVYHDTDLGAAAGVMELYHQGVPFSSIQKAFSVGGVGARRARRLVPTRWSITACDSTIGNSLLEKVKTNPILDTVRVYEYDSLHNHYAVLLFPTAWQYEWTEAFLHILGREEMVFSDYEGHRGKAAYSSVGGCYYSCRMALLEALHREQIQAGAIVLREAYQGYVPLGVFNVRENVRNALLQPPREFETVQSALSSIAGRINLPIERFIEEGSLLKDLCRGGQTTLKHFGL
jgi:hypothetical protein